MHNGGGREILVVEDEPRIAKLIADGLTTAGMRTRVCGDGEEALQLATSGTFAAAVLDIMLPGRDGLSVLRELRQRSDNLPVILLTARGGLEDRLTGLDAGADDYLTKPFSVEELVARLRALWRRVEGKAPVIRQYGDVTLDLVTHDVVRAGQPVELTGREYDLLELLMRTPGRVFTRTELCEQVWDYHFDPGTNVVDVCVQRLRRKLDDGHEVKLIKTVRGVGYSLKTG
jgi:two-component system OmpR family response regulator